jgi:hypothetical protein
MFYLATHVFYMTYEYVRTFLTCVNKKHYQNYFSVLLFSVKRYIGIPKPMDLHCHSSAVASVILNMVVHGDVW